MNRQSGIITVALAEFEIQNPCFPRTDIVAAQVLNPDRVMNAAGFDAAVRSPSERRRREISVIADMQPITQE
jgi:hypothetical protein